MSKCKLQSFSTSIYIINDANSINLTEVNGQPKPAWVKGPIELARAEGPPKLA